MPTQKRVYYYSKLFKILISRKVLCMKVKNRRQIATTLVKELSSYTQARAKGQHDKCVYHLGRAHILSQHRWFHHFYVHFLMFEYSWRRKDWSEVRGQLLRMIATIPGHIFRKLPLGNTGWSNIGLMQKLPLPEEFKRLF